MTNAEIRQWAKAKIKGKIWTILPAIIIAGILTNLSIRTGGSAGEDGVSYTTYSFGWIFYFVEVGLTYFMIKFINDEKTEFNDIFHFSKDFGRCLGTGLLSGLFVFLWALLLIVPGIMKLISYALVPMLLADEKYRDLSIPDILKKSEELMLGHKMDYFMLWLSFIGWHFLAILTLGILEIWVAPYQRTALTKFLYDLKTESEGTKTPTQQQTTSAEQAPAANPSITSNFCPNCGSQVEAGTVFCTNCGQKIN